jgi:multimeric flavodoxin WrbA
VKIVVISGTAVKGCTHNMKMMFLEAMGGGHEVVEYTLPKDCPEFCTGCKFCFYNDISKCPHGKYTIPIWDSISAADLIVITSPVYVFHATAQVMALLDHYGSKWMAHSPEKQMFKKRAVIITNAIGQGMGNAVKDIKDSLDFWGVSRTLAVRQALFDADWERVAEKRKAAIHRQCQKVAAKLNRMPVSAMPRLKIKILFTVMKFAQTIINKSQVKSGYGETKDYRHWKENGFLDGVKPWKS